MKAIKIDKNTLAIHSDDVKKLVIGDVFNVKIDNTLYDLVLYAVTEKQYKNHTFKHYEILCLSHDMKVTEYLDF